MNSSRPTIPLSSCEQTTDESSANSDSVESTSGANESLESLIEQTQKKLDGNEVTIGALLNSFENRGFGPLLLIPALISISPLGTIPGMSAVTGSLILLIAIQMLFRSDYPWIPKRLESVSFGRDRFDQTVEKMSPWVKWMDRWIRARWEFMSTGPMHYVVALVMILLSLTYYPLAVVPFGVMLPGTAMAFFALGMTARDGYLISFGLIATCGAFYGMIALWPF